MSARRILIMTMFVGVATLANSPTAQILPLLTAVAHDERLTPQSASDPADTDSADNVDLILVGEHRAVRLQIQVDVDGHSVTGLWDTAFGALLAYHDVDGNGRLDRIEALGLPSAFCIRQVVAGLWTPYTGKAPPWADLDLDQDGRVSRIELGDYYRRSGLGSILLAVGNPPATERLTAALLRQLDVDENRIVSTAEWQSAAERLQKLDQNDDELVSASELVATVVYPGATGSQFLNARTSDAASRNRLAKLPLIVLPFQSSDASWTDAVVRRQGRDSNGKLDRQESGIHGELFTKLDGDGDGKLSAGELAKWREVAPDVCLRIAFQKETLDSPFITCSSGADHISLTRQSVGVDIKSSRLILRGDAGTLATEVMARRDQLQARFLEADINRDGVVSRDEVGNRRFAEVKQLLAVADRNRDGRLSKDELLEWLELYQTFAAGHFLLTVLDHGAGLFEALDTNRDAALSLRELRQAALCFKSIGDAPSGTFDVTKLPRHVRLTISHGQPRSTLEAEFGNGPDWFKAMDRNRDGDLSVREFFGPSQTFQKLDADRDGLISPEEAQVAR